MKEKILKKITVDPTSRKNNRLFFPLVQTYHFIPEYQPIKTLDNTSQKKIELVFTHPVFQFEKPERKSQKTGKTKPVGTYIAVFDPEPLGKGEFGAVYPVLGVWKLIDTTWVFKTKSDPSKERVVKTNALIKNSSNSSSEILKSYQDEQQIGQWVQHMGYKYPVVTYKEASFLLMRKQSGVSLESIIKQLKVNPNYLTITNKLKITVNLLKELHNQVNGVQIPTKPKTHNQQPQKINETIVHRDIKPSNIIIAEDYSVKFIDYGLAKKSNEIEGKYIIGTSIYIDPKVYDGSKLCTDHVSDLASLSRTIAELWGDKSAELLYTSRDIINRNKKNLLSGLNFSGLTENEESTVFKTILVMISYEETERCNREEALKTFEQVLAAHVANDNQQFLNNLTIRPIEELSAEELLELLKSSKAQEFLKRFKSEPGKFFIVFLKLRHKLLQLDESILNTINDHYCKLNSKELLPFLLDEKDLTATQVKLLIKLGTPVEALKYWVNWVDETGQELRWASICRVLYQATPNAADLMSEIPNKNSFKFIYYQHFLSSKKASSNDKNNVRLVKRHLEISKKNEPLICEIEQELSHFKDTPFANAIMSSQLINKSSKNLLLAEDSNLYYLPKKLKELRVSIKKLNELVILEGMTHRSELITSMHDLVKKITQLEGRDWASALAKAHKVASHIIFITTLDSRYKRLKKYSPTRILSILSKEFDDVYQRPHYSSKIFTRNLKHLINALKLLDKIEGIKEYMINKGIHYPLSTLLEKNFTSFIDTASLINAQPFYNIMMHYYNIYLDLSVLFNELSYINPDLEALVTASQHFLKQTHSELGWILPPEQVEGCMTQLRGKTLEILDKKIKIKGSQSKFSSSFVFYPAAGNKGTNKLEEKQPDLSEDSFSSEDYIRL